jgi:hypothetical protein
VGVYGGVSYAHTSGSISAAYSVQGNFQGTGSGGTTAAVYVLRSDISVSAGHTITTAYGVFIATPTGAGTIGTRYGIYQQDTAATNALLGGTLAAAAIAPKTAGYTVTATEPDKVFTNEGAGASVTFTLPAAAAGLRYTFYVQAAKQVVLDAAAGDTIRVAATVSSAGGTATNAGTQGDYIEIIAINATEWVEIRSRGTWTLA